jgi:exopolysaccharide production protein ExoZ
MTSVVVAIMLFAPSLLSTTRFDPMHVAASYLFIPWLHPVLHGEFAPVIIPGWTLNYEIAFYAVLGFALFVPLRWRALAVIAAILAPAFAPALIANASPIFVFYTQPIIAEFAVGILIGWLVWSGVRLPAPAALALIVAGVVSVILLPSPSHFLPEIGGYGFMRFHVLEYCVPSFAIVAGAVFYDSARPATAPWKLPSLIGDAAYSIYIVHVFVLAVLTKLWCLTGLQTDWRWNAVYVTGAVVASTAAGIVCHFTVELPIYRFFDRLTRTKRIAVSGAQSRPFEGALPST